MPSVQSSKKIAYAFLIVFFILEILFIYLAIVDNTSWSVLAVLFGIAIIVDLILIRRR